MWLVVLQKLEKEDSVYLGFLARFRQVAFMNTLNQFCKFTSVVRAKLTPNSVDDMALVTHDEMVNLLSLR